MREYRYDYARIPYYYARISHDFDKSSFNLNAQTDDTGRKGDRGKGIGDRNGVFCHGKHAELFGRTGTPGSKAADARKREIFPCLSVFSVAEKEIFCHGRHGISRK